MFEIVEKFRESKTGSEATNEDFIADGVDWVAVVDGATDITGTSFGGRTGGQIAAEATAAVIAGSKTRTPIETLLRNATAAYNTAFADYLSTMSPVHRPACTFVALDKKAGVIVRVGDDAYSLDGQVNYGVMKIDEIHAQMRSAYLRMLIAEGHSRAELKRNDPGREVIKPGVLKQGVLSNSLKVPDLAYGVINGRPIPRQLVHVHRVDPEVSDIVLASDGYPEVLDTLEETEKALALSLRKDPLRILGDNASTKGVQEGNVSFDDRTYVRLQRI